MIKKTAIAFATSILLGAGASLTALPAAAADAPVKAEQVKSLPNIAILATGGTIASRGSGSLSLTDYGVGSGHKPVGIEVLTDACRKSKISPTSLASRSSTSGVLSFRSLTN